MERLELARLLGARADELGSGGEAVIIEQRDAGRFQASLAAAVAAGGPVFLADPGWGEAERGVLSELVEHESWAGDGPSSPPTGRSRGETGADARGFGWLMIPSGGTSGRLKFARHDQDTIAAAVRGICSHFAVQRMNCVGVLPLHHVSGLMAWMRAALTGGEYLAWDWKRLESGDRPTVRPGDAGWFLSLVPTQLQRLLGSPEAVAWLRGFQTVFVGGGPVWPELADAAARAELPLSLGYGMTETAAMATALRPAEFLAGDRSSGAPLPHLRLDLTGEGRVRIAGGSVFRGYFPDWDDRGEFASEDLGRFDARGYLEILGRRDALIITGGEKADPLEIERVLRSTGEFTDVAVIGVADAVWGRAVVACYPATQRPPDAARVAAGVQALASYQRPRRYLALADWPRNEQGKVNRAELERRAEAILRQ
jgi:o-succinylbenzoate---CoA ligase